MIQYNSNVIQEFAANLYKQATSVVISYTVIGLLLGALAGGVFDSSRNSSGLIGRTTTPLGLPIGAVIGALIGYTKGQEKAFLLKLQAQLALCQMKIEQNTSELIS